MIAPTALRCVFVGILITALASANDQPWLTHMKEGDVLLDQGRYLEALRSYRTALEEAGRLGSDQSAIAVAHNRTGIAYLVLRDFRRAEAHLRESGSAFEAAGQQRESARVLINVAMALRHQRRFAEAAEANRRAAVILETLFGAEHPEVVPSLISRGELLLQLSQCGKAAELFASARSILGSTVPLGGHVVSLAVFHDLGLARLCLGDHVEARRLIGLVLEQRELALPPDHPDIAESLYAYGKALEKTGQRKEAREYKNRATAILSRHYTDNLIGLTVAANAPK